MLIEIFADLVCPWCYIGKNRLTKALADRLTLSPTIRWLPFQLNPDMPLAGMDRNAYLSLKFGSPERAFQVSTMLEQTAERDGISLNLARIKRTPNTIDAHRLVRFASRSMPEDPMVNQLMARYFIEGDDISDHDVLIDVATQSGLDATATKDFLNSNDERAPVRNSDLRARRLGIHAVPCFIIDQRYAIAGAHETETFDPLFDLSLLNQGLVSQGEQLAEQP